MFEVGTDGTNLERVYRVDDLMLYGVVFKLSLCAALPLLSLYELFTTGSIDMEAVGRGRLGAPMWSLYLFGWSALVATVWAHWHQLRYFGDSEMFRLGQKDIKIRVESLAPEEVLGFRYSFLRGHVLQSTRGDFPIHPWMIKGAVEALADAFPHVTPPKQRYKPSWLLGD
ncbi:MAG: hypothetical protein O9266_10645 [Porphyrobacter sp.]|jgi:hypothetical protein|nr:hypothetical protein [Porphyrobacter sp.]